MKKVNLKFSVSLIVLLLIVFISTITLAASGLLTVRINPDASKAISDKEVYVTLSLTDFNNVETDWPMAAEGTLEYDKTIFDSVSIEGLNGWSASINTDGTMVLDTNTVTDGEEIARITLKVNDNAGSYETEIKVNSFSLTNGEDAEGNGNVNIENMNLTAKVTVNNPAADDNDENNNDNSDNNNENPGSTDDEEQPNDDTNQPDDNTNNPGNTNDEENGNDTNTPGNTDDNSNNSSNNGSNDENKANTIEKVEDLTVSKNPIPQTGVSYAIFGIITFVVVVGVIAFIRYKKFYD